MNESNFDVTVIGAGPGGYVAAIRAAQLGLKTAIIEKRETFGGTCLNVGCIPSKALLDSSNKFRVAKQDFVHHGILFSDLSINLDTLMSRKEKIVKTLTRGVADLIKANGIHSFSGVGKLLGESKIEIKNNSGESYEILSKKIILATGSAVNQLPALPFDHTTIIDSTDALSLDSIPERLLVIGAGAIGLEMASVWSGLGSEVTAVELMPQILPGWDTEIAKMAERVLKKQGIEIITNANITSSEVKPGNAQVSINKNGKELKPDSFNKVLVAVGRHAYTEDLGLENVNINPIKKTGKIEVNKSYETSAEGIYAIGDIINGPMLAHKAEDEGIAIAEIIAGKPGHVNYETIPGIVYTHPEIASVGKTEENLKKSRIEYNRGVFYFRANGKALAMGENEGFVKILSEKKYDRILGAHIIGPSASDLIGEIISVMEFGGSSEDIARTVHAHPTLSEVIKEAALDIEHRAIHTPPKK